MTVTQAAMRRRARIMRAVNVPIRAALSLPFPTPLSGNLMLVSYRHLDPDALDAAIRHGFCIVRWHRVMD